MELHCGVAGHEPTVGWGCRHDGMRRLVRRIQYRATQCVLVPVLLLAGHDIGQRECWPAPSRYPYVT